MPAPPFAPTQFGKYMLVERIASGGMAEVYRAVLRGAAGFEKTVALKRILPIFNEEHEFITLFQDEARTASTLTHANLVQTFDFGEEAGSFYLALELVEGSDLSRLCERLRAVGQPFPTATAAFVVAEAARGLGYAHEKRGSDGQPMGIIHRDVSPQNILVSYEGEVKVADFGIAKAARKVHRTMAGVVMGKLKYMSPEQVAGDELDARSDVFSLGVILYELLTGGTLFPDAGSAVAELIHAAPIKLPSQRVTGVPKELDDIVMKALARPREKRYARAADLARDLTVWVNQSSPGFTREDLATLVVRMCPPSGVGAGALAIGSPGFAQATPAPAAARDLAPPTAALRKNVAPPGPPPLGEAEIVRTPSSGRLIANPADPHVDPRAATEMRQLDVPTRTRLPDTTMTDPEALAAPAVVVALTEPVARLRAQPFAAEAAADAAAAQEVRAVRSQTERARPSGSRRSMSTATVISLVLVGVIVASGAFVLLRLAFVPSGPSAESADAAGTGLVGADAALELALVDAGGLPDAASVAAVPFELLPMPTDPGELGRLAEAASERRATRGVAEADYELLLAALDFRIARLTLDASGRAEPAVALPDALGLEIAGRQLKDLLDALTSYLRRTGDLPPNVRAAAKKYLRNRAAWDPARSGAPLALATLAVWLDRDEGGPPRAARLIELARQNEALGRFCAPLAPPRRRFAPYACEPGALATELRGAGDEEAARALERWQAAPAERATRGAWTVKVLAAQWDAPAQGTRTVRVQVFVSGGSRPPETAFSVLAGGTAAPVAPLLGEAVDVAGADAGTGAGTGTGSPPLGETRPPLVFSLPAGAFATVLRVELEGGPLLVRLPPQR